jgi:hypothetical protein
VTTGEADTISLWDGASMPPTSPTSQEALKLYHEAADAWLEHAEFEVPMDTQSSKRVLVAVEEELSKFVSTSDASSIDTGEMQHLHGKEGNPKLEGEAQDVDEE